MLCPKPGAKNTEISVIVVHDILDGCQLEEVTCRNIRNKSICVRACVRAGVCVRVCVRARGCVRTHACMHSVRLGYVK